MLLHRYSPAIAAAALILAARPVVVHAQSTGLEDMVGARAGQAESELQRRGYRNIRAEQGDDRAYSYWWNADRRQCVTIATMNGRYDSITPTTAPDCRQTARTQRDPDYAARPDYSGDRPGRTAGLPTFNGSCPGDIDVHADEGGPIYLNGREATLNRINDKYYEATDGRTTVSVSINPDRRVIMSYTQRGAGYGVCEVSSGSGQGDRPRPRPPLPRPGGAVAMGDLPRLCQGQASSRFGVRPDRITANAPIRQRDGYIVQGWYDQEKHTKFFNCRFDPEGRFLSVY